jgi:hypothetical protein
VLDGGATMSETIEEPLVREATREEGWAILDAQAQRRLSISGKEFVERWDRGEYLNCEERPEVMHVAMLLPFVR